VVGTIAVDGREVSSMMLPSPTSFAKNCEQIGSNAHSPGAKWPSLVETFIEP
jgi:hypothetical protein